MMEKFKTPLFFSASAYNIGEGFGFQSCPLGICNGEEIHSKLN